MADPGISKRGGGGAGAALVLVGVRGGGGLHSTTLTGIELF